MHVPKKKIHCPHSIWYAASIINSLRNCYLKSAGEKTPIQSSLEGFGWKNSTSTHSLVSPCSGTVHVFPTLSVTDEPATVNDWEETPKQTVAHLEAKNQRGRLDVRGAVDSEDRPLDRDPRQRLPAAGAGMCRGANAQAQPRERQQQQPHQKPGVSPIPSEESAEANNNRNEKEPSTSLTNRSDLQGRRQQLCAMTNSAGPSPRSIYKYPIIEVAGVY